MTKSCRSQSANANRRVVENFGDVEHLDAVKDNSPGISPVWVDLVMKPFALEQLEVTLSYSVVVIIPAARHTLDADCGRAGNAASHGL